MSRKKDCFGSETFVCRTKDCPYVAECVQVVWEKKLRRIVERKPGVPSTRLPALASSDAVRVRSRDFLRG
jgi:hypothetical protein